MKQYRDCQIYSTCACRTTMSRISMFDGTMHCYQQVKLQRKWSCNNCTSQNCRILFSFRLYWPCTTKRLFETMANRAIQRLNASVRSDEEYVSKNSVFRHTTDSYVGDKLLIWSTSIFVQLELMKRYMDCLDLFNIRLQNDKFQDFDVRWDQAQLSATETPTEIEIIRNNGQPSYQRLKASVRVQLIRRWELETSEPGTKLWRGATSKSQKGKKAYVERKVGESFQ